MKINIIIYPGFDELDALGPYEVLSNAAQSGADADVALVTVRDVGPVTGSHGATVLSQRVAEDADLIVVPGGGWNDRSPQGARAEVRHGDVPRYLVHQHAGGATIAGVCTGVMLLAGAGLLTGRPAITHQSAVADLTAAGAQVLRARVVDDGDIVTAGGVTSGIDMALHLVERYWGAALADGIATEMEHTRRTEAQPIA